MQLIDQQNEDSPQDIEIVCEKQKNGEQKADDGKSILSTTKQKKVSNTASKKEEDPLKLVEVCLLDLIIFNQK